MPESSYQPNDALRRAREERGWTQNEEYFIARQVGHTWIETDRLIVLLDDLHQVPEALRHGCVEAIDAYQQAHPEVPLVVCCQTDAYFAQSIRLRFSQAIQIQPLTPAHIALYLDRVSAQHEVRQALLEDQSLLECCSNPFLLRLMVELTNQGEPVLSFVQANSMEMRRQHLFDLYVHRHQDHLTRPADSEERTITSLSWLARQMTRHHHSTYYVERMQPTWLPDQQAQQRYRLTVTRLFGAITALLFSGLLACFRGDFGPQDRGFLFWLGGGGGDRVLGWMAPGIGGGMSGSISLALLFALVVILVNLLGDRKRVLIFSRSILRNACKVGLRWGVLTGVGIGSVSGIIFSRDPGFTCLGGSTSGITCGGSLGLFGGILIGFQVALITLLRYHARLRVDSEPMKRQAFSLGACLLNALLFGVCGCVGFAAVYSWQAGGISAPGIGYSLISGVYFGLLYHQGIEAGGGPEIAITIQLAETVTWSWEAVRFHLLENVRKGISLASMLLVCVVIMITCISSLLYGISYGVRYGLVFGVVVATISGITGMLMGILTSGWSHTLLDERDLTRPGEGIRRARRNALFAACLFGPIGGLSCGLASALAFALGGVSGWPTLGMGLALILTVACWYEIFMLYGGIALVEHYVLRWTLWRSGLLPWNCFTFFHHAVERVLLKKWGGGYTRVNPFYRTRRKVNFRRRVCRRLQTQQEVDIPSWSEVSSHYTLFR